MGKRPYGGHHHSGPNKRQRQPPPTPSECFFCLSNTSLATHLITSIGNDAYLTIAKGPLTTRDTFSSPPYNLPFPGHMLIIPLTHTPTISLIQPPDTRRTTNEEMLRYKDALQKMVAREGNGKLGAVTWEVSRAAGIHVHWQFLPVPVDLCRRGLVEAGFKVEAENERYPGFVSRDVGHGTGEMGDFFRVWIWSPPVGNEEKGEEKGKREVHLDNERSGGIQVHGDVDGEGEAAKNGAGGQSDEGQQEAQPSKEAEAVSAQDDAADTSNKHDADLAPDQITKAFNAETAPAADTIQAAGTETSIILPLDASFRFDMQFGRKVMAMLLGLESRLQWQDCGQSQADETADAEEFKKAFKDFDFSLAD